MNEEDLARAQESLWKQSEWLRVTLASIGDAVMTTDTEGRVLTLNGVAEGLTGWTQSEARGRPLPDVFRIVNEETRQPVEDPSGCALRDGRVVGLANHTVLIARDGTETPIDDSAAPIKDDQGRVHGVVLIFRSIAERRRAQVDQARLAAIVESSEDAIISKDLNGIIASWNSGAERLFGYSAEETIGQPITLLIPSERLDEERMILDRLRRGERVDHFETVRMRKDGSRLDISLTISPIRDAQGRIVGASKIARDISVRKRAEEALRRSEERMNLVRHGTNMGYWYCDLPFDVLQWDEHVKAHFHLPPDAHVTIETFYDRLHPEDREPTRRAIERSLGERAPYDTDYRTVDPDTGEFKWVRAIGSAYFAADGTPIRFDGVTIEITQRKRAEEALRERENQLRVITDTTPALVSYVDAEGRYRFVNRRYELWFGHNSQEIVGRTLTEVLGPAAVEVLRPHIDSVLRGETVHFEAEAPYRDGGTRWIDAQYVPDRLVDGTVRGFFVFVLDITERKQAERATRFLADASAALVDLTDQESTLQKVAALAVPQFADWCAVDILEADGCVRRLAVVQADSVNVRLSLELDRKSPSHASELAGLTQDEEHQRIVRELGLKSSICVPLKSRTRVLGALSFVTAGSGRVYGANDLRAAEDLAHRTVIAIENARLLAKLREDDRRKDEFLAMLAHELRNPLAPVRNAVQIFRSQELPAPKLQWATEVIDRQVHQLTRLVDDLLDVSRITRGKIELRRELVDLATVLNSAVEASRPLVEKWGHELTVTLPPHPLQIEADPARLAQVLLNLLNNAAKYTDHGGRIWVTAERQSDHVLIQVKDNGIGIPMEMQPRIFDLFTQVDGSLQRSEGGLGLGLTLVQRLVEMHGGSVEARSGGPGKGSEFVVRLPLAADVRKEGRAGTGGEEVPAPTARRILVVDDNRDAAESLGMLLHMMGNEVHTAHDGLEAVGAAAAFRPDVVLLDIGLPKRDGYEAARQIREQEGGADMLLVALTGWGQEEDRRRSREAGFDHHMTKPVDFDALRRLLAETRRGDVGHGRTERGS